MLLGEDSEILAEYTIIPGLPNDVACLCLACVPLSQQGRLKAVSRAWRAALYSQFVLDLRHRWGKREELLCLFRDDPSLTPGELYDPREHAWALIPPMPCDPYRYGLTNFVCVGVGTNLYVLGGSLFDARSFPIDRPLSSGAVFRYDVVRAHWERRSSMANARGSFACGVHNDKTILVAGGGSRHAQFTSGGTRISSVERYDVDKDRWSSEQELPTLRAGCVGYVAGEDFWVMGGYGVSKTVGGVLPVDEYYRGGHILRAGSGKWRELRPMWEEGERWRLGRIAVVDATNGEPPNIFMLEGFRICRYDIASNRWKRESCLPRRILAEPACGLVALYGELYVIPGSSFPDSGGRTSRRKRTTLVLQVYNPKKREWRLVWTKPRLRNPLNFPFAGMCSIRL
uniref:TSA: Wollemia nobilis Ref_Wollemi_Transcript_4951_1735 transcribed RNA sequence n=1 Tax=Wollemia nobilis TaxID=56998 RepID=A0A0C9RXX0_9CONI